MTKDKLENQFKVARDALRKAADVVLDIQFKLDPSVRLGDASFELTENQLGFLKGVENLKALIDITEREIEMRLASFCYSFSDAYYEEVLKLGGNHED